MSTSTPAAPPPPPRVPAGRLSAILREARLGARHAATILGVAALVGCADERALPTAPQSSALLGLISPTVVEGVPRLTPLARDITVSKVIDARGGRLSIPEAGLTVTVPRGAVLLPTRFTATAVAGSMAAYDFAPHGALFLAPLRMEQEMSKLDMRGLDPSRFQVGYFAGLDLLDVLLNTAVVTELLPLQLDDRVTVGRWDVRHFSGYMVSSGRSR